LLPFISAPLIYLTSSKKVMSVAVHRDAELALTAATGQNIDKVAEPLETTNSAIRDAEIPNVEYVNMANEVVVATIGWLIWAFITGLNVYLIVMLCLGKG
jgi:metal iron transporter